LKTLCGYRDMGQEWTFVNKMVIPLVKNAARLRGIIAGLSYEDMFNNFAKRIQKK
jgi:hypothetical protein